MTIGHNVATNTFYGLAADTKPSAGGNLGAKFIEYDTGREYFSNGGSWVLLPGTGRLVPYIAMIPSQVHVAVANTVHWDLFNADAALQVRVLSILQIPNVTTAVTGIVFDWLLERTAAVGTGGTGITPYLTDTTQGALDADITCRSKPTGGATQSTDLRNYSISSEETNAATIQIAARGGLEIVPDSLRPRHGIVLRPSQGLRCVQITNSAAGNTGWLISFAVEPIA